MFVQLFIAKRYLFGKKSKNIINWVSGISVTVVAVVTIALFVVLSIFNGLNEMISEGFSDFDADLKIRPKSGKFFDTDTISSYLRKNENIFAFSEIVEEDVMLKYKDKQIIAKIKGVEDSYSKVTNIEPNIYSGNMVFEKGKVDFALFGEIVASNLGVGMHFIEPVYIYAARRSASVTITPDKAYRRKHVYVGGVFNITQEIDSEYIISSIGLARDILDLKNEATSIELSLKKQSDVEKVQTELINLLGNNYHIENRYQQHEFQFKMMQSEKLVIFIIISFILLIASFNIIGSLSMLIIDKKDDIRIILSFGAGINRVKQIFLFEGWMISLLGAIIGILMGLFICWLQLEFGLIKLYGSGTFIVSAYPIKIEPMDILYVMTTVLFIGFFTAYIPIRQINKKYVS